MKKSAIIPIVLTLVGCAGYDDSQEETEPLELGTAQQALSVPTGFGWGPKFNGQPQVAQWQCYGPDSFPCHVAKGKNVRFSWLGVSGNPGGKSNAWWKLRFTTALGLINQQLGGGSGWTFAEQVPPNGQPGPGILFLYPTQFSLPENPPRTRYMSSWAFNYTTSSGYRHVNQCIIDFDTANIISTADGAHALWQLDSGGVSFEAMRTAAVENAFQRAILHCMGVGNWGKPRGLESDQVMNYYEEPFPYQASFFITGRNMHVDERQWLRDFQPLQ